MRRTLGAVTPEDFEKLHALRRMQAVALWLLIAMAVVFAVSFSLQDKIPAFGFVRAASEGGMVGAIADWFAVTALFRHPLGLKIPHTNLIAKKKDDIGLGLGTFIEDNFLSDEVVHSKLSTISGARLAGEWLANSANSKRLSEVMSEVLLAGLTVLDDRDVQDLLEELASKHLIEPEWSPTIGRFLSSLLENEHHDTAIDIIADHLSNWLSSNPESFDKIVSGRLPNWLPSFAGKLVDKKAHSEALKFLNSVAHDDAHPLRITARKMLVDFAEKLQSNPETRKRVEEFKKEMFSSPRIREITNDLWDLARDSLVLMLKDPESDLRMRFTKTLRDLGGRLADDSTLQYKVDVWVMNAAEHVVRNYRHDIASIISETVQAWDATEAAQKIELQVGKDLQFIRINGTIVGSLAGLAIYTIALLIRGIFI